ncbi:uncharacterized protein LOC106715706 isoform X2 [Papilio machaon]|uniref:uncharacterized protein LOC106715706 isoform X2 n=1 Tax=Papilio machaon TaxID=76193 RepID=UPI001E663F64|nr:uncharacterized protein LOC106715706 isoform X2 [Papilio machaon]
MCGARAAALMAALAALLAVGEPGHGAGLGGDGAAEVDDAELDAAELAAADVPAWRELWQASLAALRREPSINTTREEVLAPVGGVAFLHCPVRNLGERGVLHGEGSDDWILQIKYVQKRDNGTYECQVASGGGGTLSRRVELRVLVPEAFILGAEEYHVDAGSAINLVCIIENSPAPPQYVFWYHNARMINYDEAQGVTVSTAPGARTQSALRVHAARPSHAGNYSCRAPGADPAHIYVYVSEGSDKMAATLSRNVAVAQGPRVSVLLYALLASAVQSTGALKRT